MTDAAALSALLRPARLPAAAPPIGAEDLVFAVAAGILAAALVVALAMLFSRRRPSPRRLALERLAAAAALPPGERVAAAGAALAAFAAARSLAATGPDWLPALARRAGLADDPGVAALAGGLYAPVAAATADRALAAATTLARRLR